MKKGYTYRNLPCTVGTWCVCGQDGTASGVLEWCRSEEDAKRRLSIMQTYPQFKNLCIDDFDSNSTKEKVRDMVMNPENVRTPKTHEEIEIMKQTIKLSLN